MSVKSILNVRGALLLLALVLGVGIASAAPAWAVKDGVDSPDLGGQVQFIVSSSGPINNPEDLVGKPDDYQCAGTLISSKWVLTAKHCITKSHATIDNSGVLVGNKTKGAGTPHRLAAIHENTSTDSALLELTEDATEEESVPYRLGTPEVGTEVEIRGWGSEETQLLQLATMDVADLQWSGATEGNRMLLKEIGEGVPEEGDSGAGVYFEGSIWGIVSTTNDVDEASAVPTNDIASWIREKSGVTPGIGLEDLAAFAEAQQRGLGVFSAEDLVGIDGPLTADALEALPVDPEPPASDDAPASEPADPPADEIPYSTVQFF